MYEKPASLKMVLICSSEKWGEAEAHQEFMMAALRSHEEFSTPARRAGESAR